VIADETIEDVLRLMLELTPTDVTHWSTRHIGARLGFSQTTATRILRAFGLQPCRAETFKRSTDPLFIDKVRMVERLFRALTTQLLPRSADRIVRAPHARIAGVFAEHDKQHARSFIRTKTADEILASVACFCQRTSNSGHWYCIDRLHERDVNERWLAAA
jgi:hypothetical protein